MALQMVVTETMDDEQSHEDELLAAMEELAGIDADLAVAAGAGDEVTMGRLLMRRPFLEARIPRLRQMADAELLEAHEAEMIRLGEAVTAAAAETRRVTAKAQATIREAQRRHQAALDAYVGCRYQFDKAVAERAYSLDHPEGPPAVEDNARYELVTVPTKEWLMGAQPTPA